MTEYERRQTREALKVAPRMKIDRWEDTPIIGKPITNFMVTTGRARERCLIAEAEEEARQRRVSRTMVNSIDLRGQ